MSDYRPLELDRTYNVGIGFIGADAQPRIGAQSFHGLPFQIGTDPQRCFIGFQSGAPPITLSVNDMAYTLVFAHTLLESQVMQGEPIGRVLAQYMVRYADGETVRIPIRERFEVSAIPTVWGQWPFLAVPDRKDWMAERYAVSGVIRDSDRPRHIMPGSMIITCGPGATRIRNRSSKH
jgi:hypothetical protein